MKKKVMTSQPHIYQLYGAAVLILIIVLIYPQLNEYIFISQGFTHFLAMIPYMSFILVAWLGLKLNQTRILFTAILMFASYLTLQHIHSGELNLKDPEATMFIKAIALGLPISGFIAMVQRETRLKSWRTLGRALTILSPWVLMGLLLEYQPSWLSVLLTVPDLDIAWMKVPQLTFLTFMIFLSTPFFIKDKKISFYVVGFSVSVFCSLLAFNAGLTTDNSGDKLAHTTLSFVMGAIVLLESMVRLNWQRVYLDELTGIPNRRALDEYLYTLEGEYSIAMMDIDRFKKFNDSYGHDEGDNALRLVAKTLERSGARVYRYGGEEFCAVFEGVDCEDSFMFANKMRRLVEAQDFYLRSSVPPVSRPIKWRRMVERKIKKEPGPELVTESRDPLTITISIGLSSPTEESMSPFDVIKVSDGLLYEAKRRGRNCVVIPEATDQDESVQVLVI
ncbi:GGDEF domain-containing protein [Pseudobacteriovorax antillogorgiicola]|uniref:diguanylate cyclase n=1 Tax=Pseudobacteriovorax antillogorgiicola TaxID=1513793 RepID=A0A1Y6BRT7_9BACT|nr:GGDEF domain-containing protein [Pseudobacteriovorax antillogorgiicola]TCS55301.1 diguanylate cyclase (GGDEF)-like protein [Pseudobacteriovorax antillogorgiicola]SMF14466.1 diguanylate cyclase (GGDEF) domain-containing protein [Pseudobacteriovorax antillogorgiicola]